MNSPETAIVGSPSYPYRQQAVIGVQVSIKQIFITIIAIVALMGGCAYALDGSHRSEVEAPEAVVAMTFDPQVTVLPDPVANFEMQPAILFPFE